MTKIEIEIDEETLRRLVMNFLSTMVGESLKESDINIEVKSTQNYKSEWETARFRARVRRNVPTPGEIGGI